MIKYSLNSIKDWNFGDDNIIKVYRNNAIVFYKVSGESPTPEYQVCFAVVDDISQYTDREFEDVYDNATEKWYKLNNLNAYEEYGVYGSGRTSCEGSTSRLPQGYTEVEYIENTGTSTINTNFYPNTNTRVLCEMEMITTQSYPKLFGAGTWNVNNSLYIEFATSLSVHWIGSTSTYSDYPKSFAFAKHKYDLDKGNLYINDTLVGTKTYSSVVSVSSPFGIFSYINGSTAGNADEHFLGKLYTFKIYDDGTLVREFIPAKRDSDNVAGLYDIVNDAFYTPMETNAPLVAGEPITPTDCVTTYEGKLTVDDGYEYEWNGSSWINLGEVSGSSKSSDFKIGDIKERVTTSVSDGDYLLFSYYNKSDISKPENIMSYNPSNNYLSNLSGYGITSIDSTTIIDPSIWLLESTASANTFYIKSIKNNMYWGYQSRNSTRSLNLVDSSSSQKVPVLITPSCKENCYGFVEKKSNASTGYGGYGLNQLNSYTNQLNWWNDGSSSDPCTFFSTDGNSDFIIYKMNASDAEYPKYYSEKSEPFDNLTFNTLAEAQTYAYNNCVYDGMNVTIDGDRYVFSGDSQSGYEWVYNPSRLPVGYTEVEYIQNTGTSYLNTNFTPNQDTRVVCDMQNVTASNYPRLWGAGAYNSANGLMIDYDSNQFQVSWLGKTSWTNYSSYPTSTSYNRHTYDLNKNYMYIDETLVGSNTYATRTASDPIGVFTYIGSGRPSQSGYWGQEHFKGKMYSFQIYDNGTLVRDLVPCIRDNDNTVGAYDIVNDVFYTVPTGYTTDTLVAGNPV